MSAPASAPASAASVLSSLGGDRALVDDFLGFVNASPSAFHSTAASVALLESAGFTRLHERDAEWSSKLAPGGKYFLTRNETTVFAFAVGGAWKPGQGFSIVAAHTDSPCLKVKPISKQSRAGFEQVGVECYGGGLWNTWFDRDLSVAGRVIVADAEDETKFSSRLVKLDRPIMRIPNLAIHLNRSIYQDGFKPNKEEHLPPVIATAAAAALSGAEGDTAGYHQPLLIQQVADELGVSPAQIRDFELSLYDTQPSCTGGALDEFIFSARLDNLMMSFCALRALVAASDDESFASHPHVQLVTLFDNEEVGSQSQRGAFSNMLHTTLARITGKDADLASAISASLLVSADMAHAVHPNYVSKHEANHHPAMHKGIVLKHNANQRYATNSVTAFVLREIARRHSIPVQDFVVRQDSGCGSTVGPMLSANTGVRTVDVGAPQLSMHSIREMCATADVRHSVDLLQHFFLEFPELDAQITTSE